jgi:hypothetical protein
MMKYSGASRRVKATSSSIRACLKSLRCSLIGISYVVHMLC